MSHTRWLVTLLFGAVAVVNAAESKARAHVSRSSQNPGAERDSASGRVSAPTLGLVVDQDQLAIRPVIGVPGAALVGDPMALTEGAGRIWLAPGQAWALVELPETLGLAVLPFTRSQAGAPVVVERQPARIDVLGFAPKNAFAAVLSRTEQRLKILAGAVTARIIDTAGLFASPIRSVAIDDSASWPVAVTEDGSVYLFRSGTAVPQLLYHGEAISDVQFLAGRSSLVFADAGRQQLVVIDNLAEGAIPRFIPANLRGGRVSLQLSDAGTIAFAVSMRSRTALRIDLAGGGTSEVELPVEATRLSRFKTANQFVFDAQSDGPIWILTSESGEMRAIFAARRAAGEQVQKEQVRR